MGSEDPDSVVDKENITAEATENRHCAGKSKGKGPKRIHKAEREKLKREQLNELFLDLAGALEFTQPNNGKASILSEAARLLKDLLGQIESLRKENASLLSESHYVTVEKNELREENSALETQIEKLQTELKSRVAQSKPDLNAAPPEFHQPENVAFTGLNATLQRAPAVFVVPFGHDPQAYPATASHVSKPHARYPTLADAWPSQLLGEQQTSMEEVQLD